MTATPATRCGGAMRQLSPLLSRLLSPLLSPLLLALLAACAGNPAPVPPSPPATQPAVAAASAQPGTGSVDVIPVVNKADALLTVSPDRADWLYPLGAQASIRVRLALAPYPPAGVPVKLRLGPEMLEGEERDAVVPAEGLVLTVPSPAQPGFVRCTVRATVNGKPLREMATIGFAPERLRATQTEPADFDAFWAAQQQQQARIAPDVQITPAPELSTPKVEAFHLSYQVLGNWQGPGRFYGVLTMPRGEGPFPAVLSVPGAGMRGYKGEVWLAERGFIALQIGIHGVPVNLPDTFYEQMGRGALDNYNRYNLDDREAYYYRRVYLGSLRASQVLAAQPKWDRKTLITYGGSQGGQLAIMVAALDPKVTAVAANYPAYSDVTGYLHGRAGGWPGLFKLRPDGTRADAPIEPKLLTTGYYDTVNFARRLKVPGHYAFGFNDEVTPPTSTYTAFNTISAPKRAVLAPDAGHSPSAEQWTRMAAWLVEQTGGATASAAAK